MGCSELPSGEWEFAKSFSAVEGEHQYKFRLGPGDWWVCDETQPTVDDGFGDRNNVIVVRNEAPAKKQAAETHESVDDDGAEFDSPTLPHERHQTKRDSLGDDVVHEKHAPLFSHEQNGSAHHTLEVPSEDVPVNFSRQDTLAVDDDEGDCEPSHFPGASVFSHERDVLHERVPTPGTDEDEDEMEHPPLMRHETLSSESGKSSHDVHETEKRSGTSTSPTSFPSTSHWVSTDSHVPAEADPNDPSLLKLDVLSSTSPIAKAVSHSSQSPSLPSVLEDAEELDDDPSENPETYTHIVGSKAHDLATDMQALAGTSERPAALMTPPRTPDESKAPHNAVHDHHHKATAEKDMREEATHDVKHHDEQKPASLDGDSEPGESSKEEKSEKRTANKADKGVGERSSRSGLFETALGLGLFVAVGVGAAWLAFMMQDPIKDGGAALTGAS